MIKTGIKNVSKVPIRSMELGFLYKYRIRLKGGVIYTKASDDLLTLKVKIIQEGYEWKIEDIELYGKTIRDDTIARYGRMKKIKENKIWV